MAMIEYITNAGYRLLQRMLMGEVKIDFTRVEMGDGYPKESDLEKVTELSSVVVSLDVESVQTQEDNTISISTMFSNEKMDKGFYFREKGLYAKGLDGSGTEEEILFSYANAADIANYIDPPTVELVEKKIISHCTQCQKTEEPINIVIKSGIYVKWDEFEDLSNNVLILFETATTRENITSGEKLSVIIGKIAKFFTDLKAVAFSGSYSDLSNKPSTATTSANGFMSSEDKSKLDGIAEGAQVNTLTGVKGSSESTYRTGNVNLTPENLGIKVVNNTADKDKSVKYAESAGSAASATKATQDENGNNIIATYQTKTGDIANNISSFTTATTRENITSGEKLSVIIGKIAKFFTDLKTVAFSGSYSDLNNKPSTATTSANGFMSSTDKSKLDGIAAGANAYTHPSYTARTGVPTANQAPAFGGSFTVTQPVSDGSGHITGMNSRTVTIPNTVATQSAAGLESAEDKKKLDGIAAGAQVNSITGVKGNVESSYRTGNVNLTPANLGALATNGDSKSNTVTFTSNDVADGSATSWTSVTKLASGITHATFFQRVSQMFKNMRYLYKVLGTTDISAIGDGTVRGAISTLNSNLSNIGKAETKDSWTTITIGNIVISYRVVSSSFGSGTLTFPVTYSKTPAVLVCPYAMASIGTYAFGCVDITTTSVNIDSNFGSTIKMDLSVLVVGIV